MRLNLNNIENVYRAKVANTDTMEQMGYELIEQIMVDNSGFGRDDERADTPTQFEGRLIDLIQEHGTLTAKITSVGQFQVFVGLFKKNGAPTARLLASDNVHLVETDDGKRAVRLYDTDIITDNGDGTLTVDNGGYATRTTHKRINEFSSLDATARQFETHINGTALTNDNKTFDGWLRV